MSDNAGGLHRTARTIIAEIERTQPEWFSEWADFTLKLLGPRPNEEIGSRAHENWNCVALGMAMAFDYLNSVWNPEGIENDVIRDTQPPEESAEEVGAQPSGDSTPEVTLDSQEETTVVPDNVKVGNMTPFVGQYSVRPPTFAVLGPDGQPLVEGYRGE